MLKKQNIRRPVAALLVILGAVMIFFAPETWTGVLLLALGVFIEAAGIALKHRDTWR